MPTFKSKNEDLSLEDEKPEYDLYNDLDLTKDCDAKAIKKAYFKVALQFHPDKLQSDLSEEDKNSAKVKFQAAGLAYSVLSDPIKKERYDRTGSWDEIELQCSTFDEWNSYFQAQFDEKVTVDSIEKLRKEYQNSAEEKKDVIESYKNCSGHMGKILDCVILSSTKDEDRFMEYIEESIKNGEVKRFSEYTKTTTYKSRQLRIRKEQREAEEAEEFTKNPQKESDSDELSKGNGNAPKKSKASAKGAESNSLDSLAQLIQARKTEKESNSDAFFERLANRYSRTQKRTDTKTKSQKMKVEKSIPESQD